MLLMLLVALIKPHKSDASGISTEVLKYTTPVVSEIIADLFTAILRHGYMPKCFRDSVLVPIYHEPQYSNNARVLHHSIESLSLGLCQCQRLCRESL